MAYILAMKPTNRLRELRKKAGLTQAELAELMGWSQPAISQLENDTRPFDIDDMRRLARVLQCAPADLLDDQDNPDRLTDEERELVNKFRSADAVQRQMVQRVAEPVSGFKGAEAEENERLQPRRVA